MKPWIVLPCALMSLASAAEPALVSEFPADARPVADDAVRERLANKVFRVERADGNGWRLEYRSNGYYFVNTDRGFADSGTWKVEAGRLCTVPRRGEAGCSEVRLEGDKVFVKRAVNGEVIALVGK